MAREIGKENPAWPNLIHEFIRQRFKHYRSDFKTLRDDSKLKNLAKYGKMKI